MCCESKEYLFYKFYENQKKIWHFLSCAVSDLCCGQAWCNSWARTRRTSAQLQRTPSWCSAFLVLAMSYILLVLERITTPWHILRYDHNQCQKHVFVIGFIENGQNMQKSFRRLPAVAKDGTAHSASTYPLRKATWSRTFWQDDISHTLRSPLGVNTATEVMEPSKACRLVPLS